MTKKIVNLWLPVENLIKYIQQYVKVDELTLHIILSKFQARKLAPKRHIIKQGQIATEYFFLEDGCIRIYYNKADKEITGWVTTQHYIFADLRSIKHQTPTAYNVQAVDSCFLYAISQKKMENLYDTVPVWQEFMRKIWEEAYINMFDMIVSYQIETAEERYERLMNEPVLFQKVPLKHLATYIGITPNSLSRIRKEKDKK